jgi:ADP-ribose pyrophosphatase YjhB (NUDIX family)
MHDVRVATSPGTPGRPNEDAFAAVEGLVVVADGATSPPTLGEGCIHGPAWYARRLVGHLVGSHAEEPAAEPVAWLAEAIGRTTAAHADTCDVTHPGTPSATVAMLTFDDDTASWLVLGDCALLLGSAGRVEVVTDDRLSQTRTAERAAVLAGDAHLDAVEHAQRVAALVHAQRAFRNRDGGFWVAAADPSAATHALVGTAPLVDVRRAALLTGGVTRAVEVYRSHTWPRLLAELDSQGPADVVRRLRALEASDVAGTVWPRTKSSDDANRGRRGHEDRAVSEEQTPLHSVSVAAVVVDDRQRVLLIQRADTGEWQIPGGVLERGESIDAGLRREVLEETGLHVHPKRLTGVYQHLPAAIVALVFRASAGLGDPRPGDEAAALRWVEVDEARQLMRETFLVRLEDALIEYGQTAVRSQDGHRVIATPQ